MKDHAVLIRYHEIALKKGNRSWFEERLVNNLRKLIQRAVGKDEPLDIQRVQGRIIVTCEWSPKIQEALSRAFGIISYSPARLVETRLDLISGQAIEEVRAYLQKHPETRTFRVFTRRTEKALPQTSMEIDREVGGAVLSSFPQLKVDLGAPQLTLGVELRHGRSYLWTEKLPGPKGLPVGSNGHLLSLLSGGIDSPVAAVQVLKRGATTSFVHFYGTPFVGEEVLAKVEDLARLVNRFQPSPHPLHVVPFGKIQEKIALVTNPKMRTLLYRRMMVRIAGELSRKLGAQGLVTGESIGQVSSQTIENIAIIDQSAELPILRPLVTWDKDEIIDFAQKIGTYETSIRPGVDCCTLFADRHPSLRANPALIAEQESRYSIPDLIQEAIGSIEIRRI